MELFSLFGSIFIKDEEARKGLDDINQKAEGVGSSFGSMIGTVGKFGMVAGTAAIGVGSAMFGLASSASEAATEIGDMSIRTGLSTDRLQELRYAADQTGVNFDSISGAVSKLTKTMQGADEGSKKAEAAFAKLGISATDSDGKLRKMDDVFPEVIKSLSGMTDETERNLLAMDFFGKGATELVPLLALGGEGMDELTKQAHDLGLVMSEESVEAGAKFGDSLDAIKSSMDAVFINLGTKFFPLFQGAMDWILKTAPIVGDYFTEAFNKIKESLGLGAEGMGGFTEAAQAWYEKNKETIDNLQKSFMDFFDATMGLIKGFVELATFIWENYGDSILATMQARLNLVLDVITVAFKLISDAFTVFAAIFRGDWEGAWEGIKQFQVDFWGGLFTITKDALDILWTTIKVIWEQLSDLHMAVFGGIYDYIADYWQRMSDLFFGQMEYIEKTLSDGWEWIKSNTIETWDAILKFFTVDIPNGIDTLIQAFTEMPGKIWDVLLEVLKQFAQWQIDIVLQALTAGKEVGTNIVDGIIGFVQTLPEKIEEHIGKVIGKITGLASKVKDVISNIFKGGSEVSQSGSSATFKVPAYASGTNSAQGGLSLVGEEGPELAYLQRGTPVYNAGETADMLRPQQPTIHTHTYLDGKEIAVTISRPLNDTTRQRGRGEGVT